MEGPSAAITFLGIHIDTTAGELRLPQEKLDRILHELTQWSLKRSCRKRELLSLIGVLHHASTVVPPGRPFLRRMINLSKATSHLHHHIRLNAGFKSDLQWWRMFMQQWNGRRYFDTSIVQLIMYSDASGSWGCGAFSGHSWFQMQWPEGSPSNIATKELIPIVLAAVVWGKSWSKHQVNCYCDNAAVVAAINKASAQDAALMHLLRCISFLAAHYNFIIKAIHLPGAQNSAADALSRNNRERFFSLVPQALPDPTPIPEAAIRMAVTQCPDWTSAHWRALFSTITAEA